MPPKFFAKKKYPTSKSKATNDAVETRSKNATYLIIVESPSKCKKIEEYLGNEYQCIASKGHIRDIQGLKAIDTRKTFEPIFTEIDEKTSHIAHMRKIISKFHPSNVILATDDDREGEGIAWHICQTFGLPVETTPRILFREITQTAILEAVANPTLINMPLVNAQKARQVLDMIVGFKISPYLWKFINSSTAKTLSAGRCQTPALRLVYDNDEENKNSKMVTQYKIRGSFTSKNIVFELNHEFDTPDLVLSFLEKSKHFQHMLQIGATTESKRSAPKPFNTSRLLQSASNVLHMTTKETMNLCQQLYQLGYITYMRTESSQYSPVFLEKMRTFILQKWTTTDYLGDFGKIENKDKTKPHEAIRVTNLNTATLQAEDTRMASLYKLIWRNTVESCMADAIYNNTTVKISAPEEKLYTHTIEIPLFMGWKIVSSSGTADERDKQNGMLFFLKTIEEARKPVPYNYVESEMVARNKHSYYTEASIIHKLEELGIGRPSTFASIVDTIQDRGYVRRKNIDGTTIKSIEYRLDSGKITETKKERTFGAEKNKLCIEPTGVTALHFLLNHFNSFFSYEYTKKMEEELDAVVLGRDWAEICRVCYTEIKMLSKPITEISKVSYPILSSDSNGKTYVFKFNKYGPVIQEITAAAAPEEENEKPKYISVKKGTEIDMARLKRGEYVLEELAEITDNCLGEFKGEKVFVKTGRYGNYIECGDVKKSIKTVKKPVQEITWGDVEPFLLDEGDATIEGTTKKGIIRKLSDCMSVRNGKFGSYVYYKTPEMKKPMFLNIKHFPDGFMICQPEVLVEWVCKTYKITL